jgi:hypothetical protein
MGDVGSKPGARFIEEQVSALKETDTSLSADKVVVEGETPATVGVSA